jgi:hypothetical protein
MARPSRIQLPVGGGIVADEVPQEKPDGTWDTGSNVRFRDGYLRKTEGYTTTLTAPASASYHIAPYQANGSRYWIHNTLTGTFADDGTVKTTITGAASTGTADNRFVSTVLGGVYVQTNEADPPKYWGGSGALATLTGWTATHRCKSIRSFKYYLIALNVTKGATTYPHMVKWSDAAEPGSIPASWDETDATKDAGEFDLSETTDAIVDGLALGDTFIVYKERSMYGLMYVGGNAIFRQVRLPGDYGILAPNCVQNTPRGHVVLTSGPDIVIHQGGQPTSILERKMRNWLASNMDPTYLGRSFMVANHIRSEVWTCFPAVGATVCTKALIWNYTEDTFAIVNLPNLTAGAFGPLATLSGGTWDSDTGTWDSDTTTWDETSVALDRRVITTGTGSLIYLMDEGDTFAGSEISASVERTDMTFGNPDLRKLVRGVRLRVDAAAGVELSVQVGATDDPEVAPTWATAVPYVVGTTFQAHTLVSGRFIGLRISSVGSGAWRIKTEGFDIVPLGEY